ncbi:MAG: acyl carrier protein [Alteromonadaceae bacterium]|jgi:acyl carrier protein
MRISINELIALMKKSADLDKDFHISLDTKLSELGVDSVGLFTLIYEVEEACGIDFDENSIESLTFKNTVDDLLTIIKDQGVEVIAG